MGEPLHFSKDELWKAFHRHQQSAVSLPQNESGALLQLYAIESALKACLLHRRGQHTTRKLEETEWTHELDELLRALGQERLGIGQITARAAQISSGKLHQLFRYGASLDPVERGRLTERCKKIIAWLEEQPT